MLAGNIAALAALDIEDKGYDVNIRTDKKVIISLRGVKKTFPSGDSVLTVLKGIDLDIFEGEFLVILGESGCGKSTMLNIVGGMDNLSEGTLTVDGKDFSHPTDKDLTEYRRDYIGFIFQSYNLMPNLSAIENIEFVAENCKDPLKAEDALAIVGMSQRAGHFPAQMSGGQQQRISIARALVKNPRVILADEPTAALDFQTGQEVLVIVEDIVRNQGKTVVMITHNAEIAKMADRVIKLRGGRISSVRVNMKPLKAVEIIW
ncbi:MAG: ABC transporter ATP-binding protein [Eubacterium sp.]|nr:ABC transporter ATP-binding protein [Eubacterium sp.]